MGQRDGESKRCPGSVPGRGPTTTERRSQPVEDLIGPEPLQALQRLVQRRELIAVEAPYLDDGRDVLLVQHLDDVAYLASLVGKLDPNGAPVDPRTLMIEISHLDQLLEVVGYIGAEIVAARAQLAGGEILIADIVEKQCLHGIDVGAAPAVELVLDHVEEAPMQPL